MTKGGRVQVYQKKDGAVEAAISELKETPNFAVDHSKEELISEFPICQACMGVIGTNLAPPCTCENKKHEVEIVFCGTDAKATCESAGREMSVEIDGLNFDPSGDLTPEQQEQVDRLNKGKW